MNPEGDRSAASAIGGRPGNGKLHWRDERLTSKEQLDAAETHWFACREALECKFLADLTANPTGFDRES